MAGGPFDGKWQGSTGAGWKTEQRYPLVIWIVGRSQCWKWERETPLDQWVVHYLRVLQDPHVKVISKR